VDENGAGNVAPSGARQIALNAPPAFLLDAAIGVEIGFQVAGRFDNRWLVFPQEFSFPRTISLARREASNFSVQASGQRRKRTWRMCCCGGR
jgi:hypothetical protein